MAKKMRAAAGISPDELLGELARIELEKEELSKSMKDSPLEAQLLSLADVSIERETDLLKQILGHLGKLKAD